MIAPAAESSLREGYRVVYGFLTELREAFHRSGRFDDSNAKLEEVAKLFATYLAYRRGFIQDFPERNSASLVSDLQHSFDQARRLPQYRLSDNRSIFGDSSNLGLRPGDDALAAELTDLVREGVDLAYAMKASGSPFDILNEAFGHFVRDNFRGNVEDAQYMTPPEVVDFMADLAFADIESTREHSVSRGLTVLDPTCGVGSFLGAAYNRVRRSSQIAPSELRLYGQDKVDRMVRLATLNLELFEVSEHRITIGNSLSIGSPIDDLNGTVDLILTNPPFGARFLRRQVADDFASNTPFFSTLHSSGSTVNSELLFIDRNLRLLTDNGRLLIVVPDSIVSAHGQASMLRQHLRGIASIEAIVELPSVAFAQAGTRTRTVILYLRKRARHLAQRSSVFVGISGDLGFQVASRKGVQVKLPSGGNDLPLLLDAYKTEVPEGSLPQPVVACSLPSAVFVPSQQFLDGAWTPKHHSAVRYRNMNALIGSSVVATPLGDLVEFVSGTRRGQKQDPESVFISVLHVLGEGLLDIPSIRTYRPKTPGVLTFHGEILLSRINPRIPRVCVVPKFSGTILCSAEFEIMNPIGTISAFALAYLLQTRVVQEQIGTLTSGTSASHNRVHTESLAKVMIPIPRPETMAAARLQQIVQQYEYELARLAASTLALTELRNRERSIFAD